MLSIFIPNAFLFEHTEEVLTLHEDHWELLGLRLNFLLEDYIIKELSSSHVCIEQGDHQHHHDFDGLLIKL